MKVLVRLPGKQTALTLDEAKTLKVGDKLEFVFGPVVQTLTLDRVSIGADFGRPPSP